MTTTKQKRRQPLKGNKAGQQGIYPWKKWFSKNTFIVRDNQYTARQSSMCVMIRTRASVLGVKVSVFPQDDGSIRVIIRKNA